MFNRRIAIAMIATVAALNACSDQSSSRQLLAPHTASHDESADLPEFYPPWVEPSTGENASRISSPKTLSAQLVPAGPNFTVVAGNSLILNGSFETNGGANSKSLTNWTISNTGNGFWEAQSGTIFNGFTVVAPTTGTFAAMTQQGGPGSHVMYQDVQLPSGATTFSFDVAIFNRGGAYYSPTSLAETTNPNQQARVDIMDPTAPLRDLGTGVLLNVFKTKPGDALTNPYKHITADLSAFAGRTVRIRFAEVDNQGYFQMGVDNVALISTDATPPVITANVSGTSGLGGWYTSDVTVSWTVTDAESTPTTCASTTITTNTASQTVTCTATSSGGSATASVEIKLDKTVPTVSGAVTSGTLGANGWYVSPVGVTWTASAAGPSGQTQSADCANTTLAANSASHTFTCTVTTGAGIASSQGSVSAKLDTSAPTVDASVAGTQGNNGWYVSDVAVTFAVADPTSGVATSTGCTPAPLTSDNAGVTYTCIATNGAGLSTTKSVSVKRDATKPVIGYTGNAGTYTADQTVAITCSASDALSGLASTTCANVSGAAYTFAIGANAFNASAADNAGNTNAATTSFTVRVTSDAICALINRWISNNGIANSLCVKVAHSSYDAFRNELSAQTDKAISASNAQILLSLVNVLDPQ